MKSSLCKVILAVITSNLLLSTCWAVGIKHDGSKMYLDYFGATYEDLYLESCANSEGKQYWIKQSYSVPSSKKNFAQVDSLIETDIKKFKDEHPEGICKLEFFADIILTNKHVKRCDVILDADRIAMDENIVLPNKEFCK